MLPSLSINPRTTREIYRAARHAWRLGTALTQWVVLNFDQPEPGRELDPQRQFRAIRVKVRSWWDYKRRTRPDLGPLTDVRTWENKNGVLHVNWLIRMPPELLAEFQQKLLEWFYRIAAPQGSSPIKFTDIYNLNGLLPYVCKGTEAEQAYRFGIDPEPQGEVWGRRAAASLNIGRAARGRDRQAGRVGSSTRKFRRPSVPSPRPGSRL